MPKKPLKIYKALSIAEATEKDSIYCIKANNQSEFILVVTDINGQAIPLKSPSSGVQSLVNDDGTIQVDGTLNKTIRIAPSLVSTINSALQSGDPISSLLNDAGYLTIADLPTTFPPSSHTHPISDIVNLQSELDSKQPNLTSGTTIKTVEGQSLLGAGNIDLSKSDVGLSNVDNTSDLLKPVSTATQTALNNKLNVSNPLATGTLTLQTDPSVLVGTFDILVRNPSTGSVAKVPETTYRKTGIDIPLNEVTGLQTTLNGKMDKSVYDTTNSGIVDGAEGVVRLVFAQEAISKGDPVYVSTTGDPTFVLRARADNSTKMPAFGIAQENIASGATGKVTVNGSIRGINTSGYTLGKNLYVGLTGGLTSTKPTTNAQPIGVVLRTGGSDGVIAVEPQAIIEVDQTIIDGSTNPVSGNAVNDAFSLRTIKSTIAEIRALSGTLPNNNFYTTNLGQEGNWYYDATDTTTADNTATVLVTADGKRIKRVIENGVIYLEWFGGKADDSTDNTAFVTSALSYLSSLNGGMLKLRSGTYITDGFTVPIGVQIQGEGLGTTILKMKAGSVKTSFIDLTNARKASIRDFRIDGNSVGTNVNGILITTTTGGSVVQLRVDNIWVYNFTGNGIHSLYGAGTWTFEVKGCEISFCKGYAIYNTATDNGFYDNNILSCDQGGIFNAGANTRYRGGKIIFCGQDNSESGGIVDTASRSQFSNIEVQENYYHGLVLRDSRNSMYEVLSDMNNVARRPLGVNGGLGISNAVGYGVKIESGTDNNKIEANITNSKSIANTAECTQFPYFIDITSYNNYLNFLVGEHIFLPTNQGYNNNYGAIKDIYRDGSIDSSDTNWKVIGTCKYSGAVDGKFRYKIVIVKLDYGNNFGASYVKSGVAQIEFRLTDNVTILDQAKLFLDNVKSDIIRVVKKGVNWYEIQIRNIGALQTYYNLSTLSSGYGVGNEFFNRDYKNADGADVALFDFSNYTLPNGSVTYSISSTVALSAYNSKGEATVYVNAFSAPVTITLPTAAQALGLKTTVIKIDSSTNVVTVKGNGSELIGNANTTTILDFQNKVITLESNGTKHFIIYDGGLLVSPTISNPTFTGSVIVPNATLPTQAVNKSQLDAQKRRRDITYFAANDITQNTVLVGNFVCLLTKAYKIVEISVVFGEQSMNINKTIPFEIKTIDTDSAAPTATLQYTANVSAVVGAIQNKMYTFTPNITLPVNKLLTVNTGAFTASTQILKNCLVTVTLEEI